MAVGPVGGTHIWGHQEVMEKGLLLPGEHKE